MNHSLLDAIIDVANVGDNQIVAGQVGKVIKVANFNFIVAGSVNVKWKSGAATPKTGAYPLAAQCGLAPSTQSPDFLFKCAVGQDLILNLSAGVQCSGSVAYWFEQTAAP